MKISIIIPVYNEINTILTVIERVKKTEFNKEIIIVDDGSSDGTRDLLRRLKEKDIRVLFNDRNRGKGFAIRTALKYITGDIVIIQDADLEYYPDEYGILIEKIIQGKADVVYGTRFLGAHRVFYFYHYLGNLFLNLIANIILNTNLTDLMVGYKAFRTSVLKKLTLEANRFGIETEITAEIFKRRYRVYEVPISYDGRTYEEGKKIKWTDFFNCLYWLLKPIFRGIDVGEDTLLKMVTMRNNNRWTYDKIKPFLGRKVLELGSGIGTFSKYLIAGDREITLTDINEEYINYLKKRFISNPWIKILNTDIYYLDEVLGDDRFDTVVGINILEHIDDDVGMIKKLKKVIIPAGKLVLIVPAHKKLFGSLDRKLGHYRRYSKKELEEKLKAGDFNIEKIEYMNFLGAIGWFIEYKLFKRERMPQITIKLVDKLIPIVALVEKYIKFPFGLSLVVVAKIKE